MTTMIGELHSHLRQHYLINLSMTFGILVMLSNHKNWDLNEVFLKRRQKPIILYHILSNVF